MGGWKIALGSNRARIRNAPGCDQTMRDTSGDTAVVPRPEARSTFGRVVDAWGAENKFSDKIDNHNNGRGSHRCGRCGTTAEGFVE